MRRGGRDRPVCMWVAPGALHGVRGALDLARRRGRRNICLMWSVHRPKNVHEDEAVRPGGSREAAHVHVQPSGRGAESAKRAEPQAATAMVVGPPGCSGCVSGFVGSRSRRKR